MCSVLDVRRAGKTGETEDEVVYGTKRFVKD